MLDFGHMSRNPTQDAETVPVQIPDPNHPGKLKTIFLPKAQVAALESGGSPTAMTYGLPASPLFDNLDDSTLQDISRRARRRQYAAGSTIYNHGEVSDSFTLVVDGKIRTTIRDDRGKDRSPNTPISLPGQLVDVSPLARGERLGSAEALTNTSVLEFSKDDFVTMMLTHSQFALNVARVLAETSLVSIERYVELSGASTYKKLLLALTYMAEGDGKAEKGGWTRINTPMTQADLAALIGATREMVNAGFKKLSDLGAWEKDGKHLLVKLELLRKESRELNA